MTLKKAELLTDDLNQEALIFEQGKSGRIGVDIPKVNLKKNK